MAIPIQCPECHKKYQAPDHMAGKRVKCKHCGVVFLIAADARSADAGADMSALDELNALSASGKHEAHARAGGGAGAAAADIDSIFQAEYAAEGAPRTNKLYIFPLSRLLDRWLPPVLLAVGLIWACYEAFNRNDTTQQWVGFFRAAVFVLAFFASVLPFTLMGVRAASRSLNYELPPRPGLRTMGSYAVPFALACAMWLLLGGVSGLLIGVLIGCVVALPVLFLLFRLHPREAPVTFGYATGSFLLSVLVSVAAVFALNLMLVGVLRAAKTDLALAVSPFGDGLKWDATPENVHKQLAQNTPTDPDEPAATTQESSDTQPAVTDSGNETAATAPSTPTTRTVVAANLPSTTGQSVPSESDVVRPADTGHADPQQLPKTNEMEKPVKANQGRVQVAGGLVGNVRVVVPGPFKQVIYPAVPAQRLAVVRDGRPGHDKLELWDTAQWQKAADMEVPRTPEGNRYVLSPEGDTLCYVTDFPRLAVQVWSFKTGRAMRAVDLEPADGPPELLGFASPEQLVLRRQRNGETVLQVWTPRTPGRPKQFVVTDFEPDPARYAISPDGNMVAFIVPGSSGADLESYSLSTGRPIKQMPIVEVNWNNNVTVAGLAFTPDSQRVSAVFADGQGAGFVVEWPAAGKGGRPLLQQLLPLGVNVPPRQPGAVARLFEGRPFSWLDNGHAFLLYGSSVLDTDSGVQLGTLDLPRPRSQCTDPAADACSVVGSDEFGGVHVFAMKLDLAGACKRLVPGK